MIINKKHVISLVLVLAMVLSCVPGAALVAKAETTSSYDRPEGRSIVVNYDGYMENDGKDWAAQLLATLPTTATIGGEGEYAITWPTAAEIQEIVNPDEVGFYFIPGTVGGVANAVTVTIQVRNKVNLIYNGDFELGAKTGWTAQAGNTNIWATSSDVAEGNYAAVVKTATSTSYKNNQQAYQAGNASDLTSNYAVKLATAVQEQGAGQYYVSAQTKDLVYSSGTTTEINHGDDLKVYIRVNTRETYNSTTQSSSTTLTPDTSEATLSLTEWVTTSGIIELDGEAEWIQTVIYLKSDTSYKNQYFLVDDIQLFPLNVALAAEPATVTGITTAPVALGVVQNYDAYVDDDWQTELGLVSEVDVTTSEGTATVAVDWDFSTLKLDTVGRYVLTGTLDKSTYLNPNNLTVQQVIYVREKTNLVYNGDFSDREGVVNANEVPGWVPDTWTPYVMKNPDNEDDYILRLRKEKVSTSTISPITANATGEAALKTGIQQYGAGQYYMQFDAKSVAYDSANTAREDVGLWLRIRQTSGNTTVTKYTSDTAKMSTEWTTYGKQFNVDDVNVTFKLDMRIKNPTANSAVYVDNIEVFPLRVELTETPALPIKYASADLDNSLDMNFYIDDAVLSTVASAKIVQTKADGTTVEQTVDDIKLDEEGDSYISYNGMAAKEMGDTITVTLYDAEENVIGVWMDSMKDYLTRIAEKNPDWAELQTLCTDLLHYGAAAQVEFQYNTGKLVNSDVADPIREVTATNAATAPEAWTGSTLTLESNIIMEVFFAKDALTGDETATVTYLPVNGTAVSKKVNVELDEYYDEWKVQIEGLALADVNTVITVTIGELTVTDSMASYAARQLGKGDIYKAILAVGESAKAYFDSLQ